MAFWKNTWRKIRRNPLDSYFAFLMVKQAWEGGGKNAIMAALARDQDPNLQVLYDAVDAMLRAGKSRK